MAVGKGKVSQKLHSGHCGIRTSKSTTYCAIGGGLDCLDSRGHVLVDEFSLEMHDLSMLLRFVKACKVILFKRTA